MDYETTTTAYNITTSIVFAGQNFTANMKAVDKFDCGLWFSNSAGINWDGLFSLTGANSGSLASFITNLNAGSSWTTKKISMYIS